VLSWPIRGIVRLARKEPSVGRPPVKANQNQPTADPVPWGRGRDPHQEPVCEQRIPDAAQTVGGEQERVVQARQRDGEEQDLECNPDREPGRHDAPRSPEIGQRAGGPSSHASGNPVHGEKQTDPPLADALVQEERGEVAGLHPVTDHEDEQPDVAPPQGAGHAEPVGPRS
jgi:hypothetical protein